MIEVKSMELSLPNIAEALSLPKKMYTAEIEVDIMGRERKHLWNRAKSLEVSCQLLHSL